MGMHYRARRVIPRRDGYHVTTMTPRAVFDMLKATIVAWNADKASRLAAAIAYSTMFAIAPLLIVAIAIVGAVLGFTGDQHAHTTVENTLLLQVSRTAGEQAAQMVRGMVDASFGKPREGAIAQAVGWILFIAGASSLFVALQDALNTVWDAPPPPADKNILIAVRDRAVSVAMLLVIGFLLMMTFVLNVAIAYVSSHLTVLLPAANAGGAFAVVNWVASVVVIAFLFALMFRILPDVEIAWADVGVGAVCTALLFVIGQALIGIYLGRAGLASAYGAAGALLAVLVWVYYSASILLLGAEFTKVYAAQRGAGKGQTGAAKAS
jgi:membrane protein